MAYQEYVQKAIATGKSYEELPAKVKGAVSPQDWKTRVRELCIQQGAAWDSSQARGVCNEPEYYEELIATYKAWGRLYPYHLAEYVARVLRVTPFRYYVDLLFLSLKEERSYDRIPNFTAADALRLTGVGRNEYIALLNTCRSKRLMWRLNKGLARELLPQAPPDIRLEPWWRVGVVNVSESEFRELSGPESSLLRAAADGPAPLPVSACDPVLLQRLYKQGLVYLTIPIHPDDRFSIPPLEGFVSNKTSEAGDESVDPFEPLLYRLFLANSSRLDQARLADILGTDLQQLQLATALAVRLGFATRLHPGSTDELPATAGATPRLASASSGTALGLGGSGAIPDSVLEEAAAAAGAAAGAAGGEEGSLQEAGEVTSEGVWAAAQAAEAAAATAAAAAAGGQGAVAVVVDAETTSCLMMGALSAGLKRHSVSLFEGGRVSGEAVVAELIAELQASAAAGALFEGEDMAQLLRVIESLGVLLACVRSALAAQGQHLELIRQESLAGLDPLSAAKVLAATYAAILPISPLPGHTLPRILAQQLTQPPPNITTSSSSSSRRGGPTFFGPPSPEADSPWLQLALYAAAGAGPVSLVFVAGCRVWRLPPQLQGCTHALLWGWGPAASAAAAASSTGSAGAASDTRPLLVEGSNLLCTLNELLSRTAVMVQPLVHMDQLPPSPTAAHATPTPTAAAAVASQDAHLVRFVDVPLPLCPIQQPDGAALAPVDSSSSMAGVGAGLGGEAGAGGQLATQGSTPSSAGVQAAAAEVAPQQQQQQQQQDWLSTWEAAFSSVAAGGAGKVSAGTAPSTPQQQQQQQASGGDGVVVQAVERTGAAAGGLRRLVVPGQLVEALAQLQLCGAVGWLRLVRLPPPAAASSTCGPAGGATAAAAAGAGPQQQQQQQQWLPLSVNLGVPLFCPALCQLVCGSMAQQQCLTPPGQAAWKAAQQKLQQQLAEAVGLAGSSSSSTGAAAAAAGSSEAGVGPGRSGVLGGGVQLPAHCLLFDGHSLLPVDVSSCLQGAACW